MPSLTHAPPSTSRRCTMPPLTDASGDSPVPDDAVSVGGEGVSCPQRPALAQPSLSVPHPRAGALPYKERLRSAPFA